LAINNGPMSAESDPWPKCGSKLGDTRITFKEVIGQGGSGRVYKGVKLVDGKSCVVALKVCLIQHAKNLNKEFKCHASLGENANIVRPPISHLGETQFPCLEYEYAERGDLRQYLKALQEKGKRLTQIEATSIVLQVVKGVAHAHRLEGKAIIHRDLKPGNILVFTDKAGRSEFRVTDFGMAHALRHQEAPTSKVKSKTETVIHGGTGDYMSPQQRACEKPDKRDDVYSLGKIWFQLLANDMDTSIGANLRKALVKIEPPIDKDLRELVASCVNEKRNESMPRDADDLLKKLELIAGQPKLNPARNESLNKITLELNKFLKCILDQSQYKKNFKITNELLVDFAIQVKSSNNNGPEVCRHLFIDSSFPRHYFAGYLKQVKGGSTVMIEKAFDTLKDGLLDHARSISEKYGSCASKMDKVIMFLPSSCFNEILDSDDLFHKIESNYCVEIHDKRLLEVHLQGQGLLAKGNGAITRQRLWSTVNVLEEKPDESVVTNSDFRDRIIATGLPWRVRDIGTNIEMLLIPPGRFMMGASPDGLEARPEEKPAHEVLISNAFYLGRTPVTQAQWTAKMGSNPSHFIGRDDSPSRPVEEVSWNMIASGSTSFMSLTGLRLPTEAEWEYAYRAGTTTAFHSYPAQPNGFNHVQLYVSCGAASKYPDSSHLQGLARRAAAGLPLGADGTVAVTTPTKGVWYVVIDLLSNIAWYSSNSGNETHPVGGKFANALGLHDMAGNVWEWCQDWYGPYASGSVTNPTGPTTGTFRVVRGDCWVGDNSYYCRASARDFYLPVNSHRRGFRVARTP
jgi:formylglycine-generating enzyme required for sulfatase activity/serine/threonine protein kinase